MKECYHAECDSIVPPFEAEFADFKFYRHILQSLLQTTMELAKANFVPVKKFEKLYNTVMNNKVDDWTSSTSSFQRSQSGRGSGRILNPMSSLSQFIRFLKTL